MKNEWLHTRVLNMIISTGSSYGISGGHEHKAPQPQVRLLTSVSQGVALGQPQQCVLESG